jgi:hypothetical protein
MAPEKKRPQLAGSSKLSAVMYLRSVVMYLRLVSALEAAGVDQP